MAKKNNKLKVKAKVLKGRGDYTQADRELLRRIDEKIPEINSGKIGRTLGNFLGQGDLGERFGKGVGQIFGFGDYEVKSNSLMPGSNNLNSNEVPVFTKDGKRGVRIVEREFIGDVVGSIGFSNKQFRIDPLDASTFPWLSKIAKQFEQWEPNGMIFQFVSTSSDFNGVGQALGTVVMATDYDVYDAAPISKVIMENYDYAQSTKPSMSCIHGIECDPKERPTEILYVGSSGPDQRFSVLGNFNIATTGMTATPVVGELWVSYDITFYKKQLVANDVEVAIQTKSSGASIGGPILGNLSSVLNPNDFTVEQIVGTGTRIHLPPTVSSGKFLAVFVAESTGDYASFPASYHNMSVNVFYNKKLFQGGTMIVITSVTVLAPGAYFEYGLATSTNVDPTLKIISQPLDFV